MTNKVIFSDNELVICGDAVHCMKRFFLNKSYFNPEKKEIESSIPIGVLICPINIKVVIDTDFETGMEIAQGGIDDYKRIGKPLVVSKNLDEKVLFLNFIEECMKLEIPKYFQGGILLLYLWLCEGINFK